MAIEFAPLGINVNSVNGGIIESDSSAYFYGVEGMPDLETQVLPKIPKQRQGTVKEVADTVEFLLEPRSEYITGQSLVVDGGLSIIAPPFFDDAAGPLRLPERGAAARRRATNCRPTPARTRLSRPMTDAGPMPDGEAGRLANVFAPVRIGGLELPHRIVMGSMHMGVEAEPDAGERLAAFYRERALGGAGLIVTGGWAVSADGAADGGYGLIDGDAGAWRWSAFQRRCMTPKPRSRCSSSTPAVTRWPMVPARSWRRRRSPAACRAPSRGRSPRTRSGTSSPSSPRPRGGRVSSASPRSR